MFDKTKEKVRAKIAAPIEKTAGIATLALIVAMLALLVSLGGKTRAV